MERWDVVFKAAAAASGAAVSYFYGGWSVLLGVLLAFIVADYITGLMAAGVEGKLSSTVGMVGIAKKICIFVIVAVGHLVDTAIGAGHVVRDAAIFFYVANELLSIIENAGRIGLPVPDVLAQAVEILKSKGDGKHD